ncbi:MAG TPA: gluconate 2-dehydrogenase subunit 3 family protein [Opitutaceae bacterium]
MDPLPRISRRTALKWVFVASASATLAPHLLRGQPAAPPPAHGYGTDPDLLKAYKPGDLWPLTFTDEQRRTAAALCDVIIPADGQSPSASAVGVVDFIDEWISAPYPPHSDDRAVILPGLAWINEEAARRGGRGFAGLDGAQQTALCNDICHEASTLPELKPHARFFAVFRNLTAGGFYTTEEGRKDLRYVGNMPLATFDGPPPEVLRQAGLA